MELKDKRIGFIGDSITAGAGVEHEENIFWNRIARWTGAICFGYGVSGTRIALQHNSKDDPFADQYFSSRLEQMEDDLDLVVVFGGTNDFGHGDALLGTISDTDETTFYGALHVLIQKLLEKYPAAELVLMTPLHRLGDMDCTYNELGQRRQANLERYVDSILQVAAVYGVPVLDLFRKAGMNPAIPALKEMYMPDGLHPNDTGHARIAQRLLGFLNAL